MIRRRRFMLNAPDAREFGSWFAFATCVLVAISPLMGATARDTRWVSTNGEWGDAARWSTGVPDSMSRAGLHGASDVRVEKSAVLFGVGNLRIGTKGDDRVRLKISGGQLVCRRDFIEIGSVSGGSSEIELDDGALQCVSAVYLGGAGNAAVGNCRAELRIRGGSFVSRLLTVGWTSQSDATLAIEGSRATAVHLLDYLTLGVPIKGREPSTSTLAFTLDERGVTPITIQSRKMGLICDRHVPENRCRLRIGLSAIPPRDDVTLVAANVPTKGTFDDLPEGAEIRAEHAGREYRWTLTYRGGANRCHLMLTNVRGHVEDAPSTRCRAIPETPKPLWESMPLRDSRDDPAAPLAFDGAEGFGQHAAGGRGGSTLLVENLLDAGPGSFRAAVSAKGPRVVEFRVAGTVTLKSPITITEPFLTVNGQSAPLGGITFAGDGFVVQTHDVILRHLSIRPGDDTEDTDALSFVDAERCIADHLSLSWGTDEVLSITGLSDSITVQWCIISEGLNRTGHGFGSIIAGERTTWHHNLFAHHVSRVPRFGGIAQADFRNNVLYNWGHTCGYSQFERVNYVGNYLKPGPSTTQRPPLIDIGEEVIGAESLFLEGNILEGHAAAIDDNWQAVGFDRAARATQPFPAPPVKTEPAARAFDRVLEQSGAFPTNRDPTDARMIQEVRTGQGKIINHARDVAIPPAGTRSKTVTK